VTKIVRSKRAETKVLDHCSFEVEGGSLTVILGPSGCGKTTIINLVAGYELPDGGEVLVGGERVVKPSSRRLVVFQETALFPWLTCYENLVFGPGRRGDGAQGEMRPRAMALLEKVGFGEFKDKYPMQLSGGMQRRAELARALINNPEVMLLDEPFRGLDAMTRELMQDYYLELFEELPSTHVFVTSEIEEAIYLGDRVLFMTRKPSRVKRLLDIDLPRPRYRGLTVSNRYEELKMAAWEILHEEAPPDGGFPCRIPRGTPTETERSAH
jgi:NitT/TauT family transport system ATP-binding protein